MPTLFQSTDEFRQFTGASVALSLESLNPYLSQSFSENEIIKITGRTLYNDLLTAYNDGTIGDPGKEHLQSLLPYVQKPLANMAVYQFMQEGNVSIMDGGIETNRDRAAFQWQEFKAEQHYLNTAYYQLDKLIEFLLTNKSDYPTWASGEQYEEKLEFFVPNPVMFNQYVGIKESYRTYLAIQPTMRNVEVGIIQSTITSGLFDQLKQSIIDQNLTAAEKKVLDFIRPATAFNTAEQAIDDLNIIISPDGSFQKALGSLQSGAQRIVSKAPAEEEPLARYRQQMHRRGNDWLQRLREFLNIHASDTKYTEYYNSPNYRNPDKTSQTYEQDKDSHIYNAL